MNGLYILLTVIAIGWITSALSLTKYLQYLRGNSKFKMSDLEAALSSCFFASPLALFYFCLSREIRDEDYARNHRFLIISIALTIIQIIIIFLLFYFGVVKISV